MNSSLPTRLADIASIPVFTIHPESTLAEAAAMMAERHVSALVASSGTAPDGIITERDVLILMHQGQAGGSRVREVMSSPVLTASADLDFRAGHGLLDRHGVRHLVLVDAAGAMTGIVTETDFRSHLGMDVFRRIQSLASVLECRDAALPPEAPLAAAVAHMVERRLDHIIVVAGDRPAGIVTERDMPRLLARHLDPRRVSLGEVMSSPVHTIPASASVAEVAQRMAELRTRHMVVVDENGLMAGIISQHHLLERLGALLMEERQTQLESRLALMLETTGIGTWEYDHAADRLQRSSTLNAMLGFGGEGNVTTMAGWLEHIHPDEKARVRNAVQLALGTANPVLDVEYRARKADGGWLWLTVRGRVVRRDEGGKPLHSAGIALDISRQKHAEARLKDQLEELRRWQDVTLGREERILELKAEVNEMLARLGQPARYPSALPPAGEGR